MASNSDFQSETGGPEENPLGVPGAELFENFGMIQKRLGEDPSYYILMVLRGPSPTPLPRLN